MSNLSMEPLNAQTCVADGPIKAAILRSFENDYELLIYVERPSPRQVEAVRRGESEFALVVEEPAILVPFRFGDVIPWTVARYERTSGPRDRKKERPIPAEPPQRRAHLDISLIDTRGDVTQVSRSVVLWMDFTRQLDLAVRDHARIHYDPSDWIRAKSRIDRRFPKPEILAAHSSARSPGCS